MAIVNGYATLAQIKAELSITVTDYDTKLEAAINAASRQIEGYCDRKFWQDSTVNVRTYWADSSRCVHVDDISTTVGLIVKTDVNDDGTYATTLTTPANFILHPVNAAQLVPVWPYTEIQIIDNYASSFTLGASGRPGVQVSAKFGWPAVPDDVVKACTVQATQLYMAATAPFGAMPIGIDGGVQRVSQSLNAMARGLLDPYVRQYA